MRAIAVGALLIVFVGAFFIGRSLLQDDNEIDGNLSEREESLSAVPKISPQALQEKISRLEDLTIIDTRPQELYAAEHLPHSRLMPVSLLASFAPENSSPVIIVDSAQVPGLSQETRQIMEGKSYTYFFLEGGFEAWKARNLPVVSAGDPESFADQAKVTFVSAEEAKKLLAPENNFFVLDVQPAELFEKKHLKGAKNIPLAELEERSKEVPSARQILVYGENELSSFQGAVRLFDLNFFAVRTLSGNQNLSGASGLMIEP